ncbi:MAG: MurR/RpiR family transcriptional regulator, partial [Enterococcus faecium]
MELEKLIHQHAEKLSELDRGILNFILSDPSLIQNLKITDLAERLYVSKSSIMRTTKKLGFSGYSEFKYFLRHVTNKENGLRTKEDIFEKQLEDIQQTLHYMKAVNLKPILQCLDRSKMIYCYATGFSQKKVIDEFYKMMLGIGKRVMVLPNKTEFDMAMPLITLEDMA